MSDAMQWEMIAVMLVLRGVMEQNARLVLFIYINKWIENIFRSVVLPPDVHVIVFGGYSVSNFAWTYIF